MDAASFFSSANLLYVNEDYEEALKHYTCAVTLQEACVEYLACRAACYLKLGKFPEALQDAEKALQVEPKSHMALHWKGIALFYTGDFAASKLAFEASLAACADARAPQALWVRKCDAELSGSALPLGGIVAQTSKAASTAATVEAAPAFAPSSREASAPATATEPAPAPAPAAAAATAADVSASGRKAARREWYQNNTHVIVTIFIKGLKLEDCQTEFQERELSVAIKLPGDEDEQYSLDLELFDAVVPDSCKVEVSKVKVEIHLAKKNIGLHWAKLEKPEEAPPQAAANAEGPAMPAYPSSSKVKRDWSQIDKDIDADLKAEKPQGDEALNKLFREIYDRADDETRRAMNKSFQTSGGTVLSTNWGEVAKADYEGKDRPTPPEGQEWRDWRKKT